MKARAPHEKTEFTFDYRGDDDPPISIHATCLGKAWRELRRHHEHHAKKKDYVVKEIGHAAD